MKVLTRQLDALDASVFSFHRVAEDVASGNPEGVRRVLEPLPVEGRNLGPRSLSMWSGNGRRPERRQFRRGASARGTATPGPRRWRVRGGPPGARGRRADTRAEPSRAVVESGDGSSSGRALGGAGYGEAGTAGSPSASGRHQVDEHVWVERRQHADRQLVGEVPDGLVGPSPNVRCGYSRCRAGSRDAGRSDAACPLAAEPGEAPVVEHGIQQHDALDHPALSRRLSEPAVGLADGRPERLVVDVEHPAAMQLPSCDRRR